MKIFCLRIRHLRSKTLESRNSEAPAKAYGVLHLPAKLEFGPRNEATLGLTMFWLMDASITVASTVSQKQLITAAQYVMACT